jgi:hypothetical protein
MAALQPIDNRRDSGSTLLLRSAKPEIVAARLQDDDIGAIGDDGVDAAEHTGCGATDDAGTDYRSIDTALPEDGLQLSREGIPRANAPAPRIAGPHRNNLDRVGTAGPGAQDERKRYSKPSQNGRHYLTFRKPAIMVLL